MIIGKHIQNITSPSRNKYRNINECGSASFPLTLTTFILTISFPKVAPLVIRETIDKYILQQKQAKGRRKQIPDKNNINKNNEFTVLKFNDNIKHINYLLTSKRKEIKNIQKKLYYKDNNNLNLTQGKEYEQ